MKPTLSLPGLTLGGGMPHIVVSITGKTETEIRYQAQQIAAVPEIALAEWRADHFENGRDPQAVLSLLQKLHDALRGKPLIFTFRTLQEGGAQEISPEAYHALCKAVAASHLADLIDVQMFLAEAAPFCVQDIHAAGGKVLGSWHDFEKTPPQEEIAARFEAMQQLDADVVKIAVMPHCAADADTLINAARAFSRHALRPLCAISMGEAGRITRTHGETFGSCLTFGALESASAPGQLPVRELYDALAAVHENCHL